MDDFLAAVAAELLRRYGVPWPDGLRREAELAFAAAITPAEFVARLGYRFALDELPPRQLA